jgi:hypothetical protein
MSLTTHIIILCINLSIFIYSLADFYLFMKRRRATTTELNVNKE